MTGTTYPTAQHEPSRAGAASCALMVRVGRILQDLAAEREVTSEEIHQHARDCNDLMEAAYARYQETRIGAEREESVLWMHRRDEALRVLSRRGHTFVDMGR